MKALTREAFGYALLLIILFGIASLAVREALDYVTGLVPIEEVPTVTAVFVSLSLGFMLVAGAFGVWTIHATGTAESRRRIAELVDSMDYIRDGVLAVDRKGRIRGANKTARNLSLECKKGQPLALVFPSLSQDDQDLLLGSAEPVEIERTVSGSNGPRELRFRSQPSAGVTLILASDISAINAERQRRRQVARLQLIGHLARGVANDFNSILCTIAGHAALLGRLAPGVREAAESINAITRHTERGIALVTRLLEVSQTSTSARGTTSPTAVIRNAIATLSDNLPLNWRVEESIESLPSVGLTDEEIEQIVTHLGLLVADRMTAPGCIIVRASRPDSVLPEGIQTRFAGVLVVEAGEGNGTLAGSQTLLPLGKEEAGAVESILRSMIEDAGGQLDRLVTQAGNPVFRVWLPASPLPPSGPSRAAPSAELLACVANWRIFTSLRRTGPAEALLSQLAEMGLQVERFDDILSLLSRVEDGPEPDAILLDATLCRNDMPGLIRAVVRLKPAAGVVVLTETPDRITTVPGVVNVGRDVDTATVVAALVEARSIAAQRIRQFKQSADHFSQSQPAPRIG